MPERQSPCLNAKRLDYLAHDPGMDGDALIFSLYILQRASKLYRGYLLLLIC